jgi:DNA (cytosine-5)-methyltransferase 1
MRFIDLFAGLGGFHLAARRLGAKCVFASELEPKLRAAYETNFGMKSAGDIRQIAPSSIPEHDLLCAGFPCQPFSKAGDQKGWKDAVRGTVFFNIVEILRHHRPQFLILENVAHFVRHDSGNTYEKVKQALESLGYEVRHEQFSPHQFGVPQIRERIYMVGRLGALNGFQWPQPQAECDSLTINDILDRRPPDAKGLTKQVVDCLDTWQDFIRTYPTEEQLPSFPIWSMEFKATYPYEQDSLFEVGLPVLRKKRGCFGHTLNRYCRQDILARVPSYARATVNAFPPWKQAFIRHNRSLYSHHKTWIDKWLPEIERFPPSLQKLEWNCLDGERDIWKYVIQFRASGVRVKRPNTAPSLVAMTTTQVPIIAWERRYMTLRECARLQSMEELKHLPSGGAGFKALGNAVILQELLANS